MKLNQIIPNVYYLPLLMANLFLVVEDDGLTLIDAGVRSSLRKILRAIAAIGEDPARLSRILLTHADLDHVGSAAPLKAQTGARVYASQVAADALAEGRSSRPLQLGLLSGAFARSKSMQVAIDEILTPGQVLPILGGLGVVDSPGHTPGHLSFFARKHALLFAGDALRSRPDSLRYNLAPPITWDAAAVVASTQRLEALNPEIVCTGHGPVVYAAAGKFPNQPPR